MDSNFYLDIRVIESSDETDLSLVHIRNQIYAVIHGAFRQLDGNYAIALEVSDKLKARQEHFSKKYNRKVKFSFDIFRVFSEKVEDLDDLINAIKGHWKIRDYAVLGTPTITPSKKISGWKSYRRFRIPTLNSERDLTSVKDKEPLRNRRLAQADGKPFLQVKSKTTGQGFTVIVDIQESNDAGQGLPDGYGLARQSNPFALPVF